MKAAYGHVRQVRKLLSQGLTVVEIELPIEAHKDATVLLDDAEVLVSPLSEFEGLRKHLPRYGVFDTGTGEASPPAVEGPRNRKGPYGALAHTLDGSGWFLRLEVVRAIGTDEDYQCWCRQQPCAVCGGGDWVEVIGERRCEYAHVRRAGESGTGHKPAYRGLPLCATCHGAQHQKGEATVLNERSLFKPGSQRTDLPYGEVAAKGWFDQQAARHLHQWARQKLKATLGADSWSRIEPADLLRWAEQHGVADTLPLDYRRAA